MIPGWLTLDVYVMLIALMLLVFDLRKKMKTRQDRSFIALLVTVVILLCGDVLSRCNPDGRDGTLNVLAKVGTYTIFAGDPFGYGTTMMYIDSWISEPERKSGKVMSCVVLAYILLNFTLVTVSEAAGLGWFYSFPNRIYERGPLYVARGLMNMGFCLVIGCYVLLRRQEIRTDYKKYVMAFPLIVLFAGMLQVFVGGAAYEYAGTIFACLLLYIYVQNHNMDVDYLTGLMNRKGIDEELKFRFRHADDKGIGRDGRPGNGGVFTAYMLDLDFFKTINDDCGHESGDEALREMSELLRKAFGRNAIVGRYGGDEFMVINDAATHEEGKACVEKLSRLCESFNRAGKRPYRLGFSAGYEVFSKEKYPELENYVRRLDQLMYEEKNRHHAVRE